MSEWKPFTKSFIPRESLEEQLKALKEKIWQSDRQYADTVQPMDDDDLDELPKGERDADQSSTD